MSGKFLGAVYQPEVKPILHRAQVAGQLGVVALGIIDEIARMNLEEAGQQHAGRVGEMRARAAFYLRQIGLTETSAHFLFEGTSEVLLGHLAAEAAESAF